MEVDVGDASVRTDTVIKHYVSIGITYYKVYLYNVCMYIVFANIICNILCKRVTNQLHVTGVIVFK